MAQAIQGGAVAVTDAFVARQPIFDINRKVVGYELLARAGGANAYAHLDGDQATADALATTINLVGLDALSGGLRCFVNFTQGLLEKDFGEILPPDRMVVEVLETVEPTPAVIEALRTLKRRGYTIALDDFEPHLPQAQLLPLADVVKLDFMRSNTAKRQGIANDNRGKRTLLAEKVETYDDFQAGAKMGYEFFQGYFFCKPEVLKARRLDSTHAAQLKFLQEIGRPTLDFDKLETIIKQDAVMSVKLLRYLNTTVRATSRKIDSIKQALTLLGERPLRRWAAMMGLVALGGNKPIELMRTCVLRARFCELLATKANQDKLSFELYLAGLLSAIDAIVDSPLHEVLEQLPIPDGVRDALAGKASTQRMILDLVNAYERADWVVVAATSQLLGVKPTAVTETYCDAVRWADSLAAA
jgi:c-di-GMP-related signal transduction protein